MGLTPRAQQMYTVIKEYLETEMTQIDFCTSKQIPESTFQYWLKRYRDDTNTHTSKNNFTIRKVRSSTIPMAMSQRVVLVKVYAYLIRKSISLLTTQV